MEALEAENAALREIAHETCEVVGEIRLHDVDHMGLSVRVGSLLRKARALLADDLQKKAVAGKTGKGKR